jgi:hypothetical protein
VDWGGGEEREVEGSGRDGEWDYDDGEEQRNHQERRATPTGDTETLRYLQLNSGGWEGEEEKEDQKSDRVRGD